MFVGKTTARQTGITGLYEYCTCCSIRSPPVAHKKILREQEKGEASGVKRENGCRRMHGRVGGRAKKLRDVLE